MLIKLFWGFCAFVLISCGDVAGPKDDKVLGNAEVVFEGGANTAKDIDFTVRNLKVWRSKNNKESTGTLGYLDRYTMQIWFRLANDLELIDKKQSKEDNSEQTQWRYSEFGAANATDDGILFAEESAPGTTTFKEPDSNPLNSEGLYKYTVTKSAGLIRTKFPVTEVSSEETGTLGSTTTKTILINAHELGEKSWKNIYEYKFSGTPIAVRTRYEENKNFKTTARVGCRLKKQADGKMLESTYIFGDVEVGDLLKDNKDDTTASSSANTLGDDDSLWIRWEEAWFVSNIDLAKHEISIVRVRSAPLYGARELPGVDAGDTSPKASGLDELVRKCNKEAGENGMFSLVSLGGVSGMTTSTTSVSPTLVSSSENSYCASLESADSETLNFTSASYGTCGFNISGLQEGTWNGTTHIGPVRDVNGGLRTVQISAPVILKF